VAHVVLFHHAIGLTRGVAAFADKIRQEGHVVTVPDLFEGRTFDSLEDGVRHAESIGFDVIADRGGAAVAGLEPGIVTAGFSLGVLPAQKIAQTRPGVLGAILYSGAVPPGMFGGDWPADVGLQMHLGEQDPWCEEDLPVAQELARTVEGAELYLYETSSHLVCDESLPGHDVAIERRIIGRSLAFLDRYGPPAGL
jgi:dienelactone hydrolase